jgi:hypothetical protein
MPKRLSAARVKQYRNYTYAEAARAIGGKICTLQSWVRAGLLSIIRDKIPYLIRGRDLIDCITLKYARKPLALVTEFFCLGCKAPRSPAFDEVELVRQFPRGGGLLRGLCCCCGCLMHRQTSPAQLSEISRKLRVTNTIDL